MRPLPFCPLGVRLVIGEGRARAEEFTRTGRRWGASDSYVRTVARAIGAATADPIVRRETALAVLQCMTYRPDPPGTDVMRAPCEIVGRGGDCNNLAAFLVGVLFALGQTSRCEWIDQPQATEDHVAVLARTASGGEEWLEPTVKGARRGEHPRDAARRLRGGRAL